MAKENVKKFIEELSTNKELQEKLIKAQESYTGDKADRDAVVKELLLPVARESGYEFTAEEVLAVDKEKSIEQGISEEELENVSGGWSGCMGLGASSGWACCIMIGFDAKELSSTEGGQGVGIDFCFYVGIGVGGSGGSYTFF